MTKDNLDEMLELTLEMEGLITLMLKREDMTPPRVVNMLKQKAVRFNELLNPESVAPCACAAPAEATVAAETPVSAEAPEETVARQQKPSPAGQQEQEAIVASTAMEQVEDAEPEASPLQAAALIKEEASPVAAGFTPVLTLNDKFRFRRTLFGGSDEETEGTLSILSTMGSMDEVKDYLFNDLCFDPDDEEVKDFIEIMGSRFK